MIIWSPIPCITTVSGTLKRPQDDLRGLGFRIYGLGRMYLPAVLVAAREQKPKVQEESKAQAWARMLQCEAGRQRLDLRERTAAERCRSIDAMYAFLGGSICSFAEQLDTPLWESWVYPRYFAETTSSVSTDLLAAEWLESPSHWGAQWGSMTWSLFKHMVS